MEPFQHLNRNTHFDRHDFPSYPRGNPHSEFPSYLGPNPYTEQQYCQGPTHYWQPHSHRAHFPPYLGPRHQPSYQPRRHFQSFNHQYHSDRRWNEQQQSIYHTHHPTQYPNHLLMQEPAWRHLCQSVRPNTNPRHQMNFPNHTVQASQHYNHHRTNRHSKNRCNETNKKQSQSKSQPTLTRQTSTKSTAKLHDETKNSTIKTNEKSVKINAKKTMIVKASLKVPTPTSDIPNTAPRAKSTAPRAKSTALEDVDPLSMILMNNFVQKHPPTKKSDEFSKFLTLGVEGNSKSNENSLKSNSTNSVKVLSKDETKNKLNGNMIKESAPVDVIKNFYDSSTSASDWPETPRKSNTPPIARLKSKAEPIKNDESKSQPIKNDEPKSQPIKKDESKCQPIKKDKSKSQSIKKVEPKSQPIGKLGSKVPKVNSQSKPRRSPKNKPPIECINLVQSEEETKQRVNRENEQGEVDFSVESNEGTIEHKDNDVVIIEDIPRTIDNVNGQKERTKELEIEQKVEANGERKSKRRREGKGILRNERMSDCDIMREEERKRKRMKERKSKRENTRQREEDEVERFRASDNDNKRKNENQIKLINELKFEQKKESKNERKSETTKKKRITNDEVSKMLDKLRSKKKSSDVLKKYLKIGKGKDMTNKEKGELFKNLLKKETKKTDMNNNVVKLVAEKTKVRTKSIKLLNQSNQKPAETTMKENEMLPVVVDVEITRELPTNRPDVVLKSDKGVKSSTERALKLNKLDPEHLTKSGTNENNNLKSDTKNIESTSPLSTEYKSQLSTSEMIINNPVKIDRKFLQNPPALQNQISLNYDSDNSQCFTKIVRKSPKLSKSKSLRTIDSIAPSMSTSGLRDELIRPMKRKCLLQDQVFDQKTGIGNNCSQSKRHRNENYVTEIVEGDVEITTEKTANRPENATAILERGVKFTTESLIHATEDIISTNIKHSNTDMNQNYMVSNETIQGNDQRLFSSRKDKYSKGRSTHRRKKSENKENLAPKIHLAKRTPIKRRSSTRYPDSDNHLDSSKKRKFVDLHDELPRPIKINSKTRRKSSSKSTLEREPSTFEEFVQDVHDISTVTKMFIRKAPEFEQELKTICMAVLIDFSGPIKKLRSL